MSKTARDLLSSDIMAPDDFAWSLESKAGYPIDLNNMFCIDGGKFGGKPSDKTKIFNFCKQAGRDGKRVGKPPMIIWKKDNRPPVAIIPVSDHLKANQLRELIASNSITQYLYFHCVVKDLTWDKWVMVSLEELVINAGRKFFFNESAD